MDIAAKYKIPHYFSGGATPLIDEKWHSKPEVYSGYLVGKDWPTPSKLMNGYMEALLSAEKNGMWKPKTRRVAIYGEDTDWGRDVGKEFKRLFKLNGFEIAAEDYFNLTTTNFYALAGKYKKLDVDVIAGSSSGPAAMAAFIKQVREVGVKATIIADGLGWTSEWYEMTGSASNYVLDMIPQLVTKESKDWAKKFEKKYGYMPSASSGGYKYDWANFFIKCLNNTLEKYGKLDSESLHEYAIEEVQTGKVSYSREEGAIVHARYRYTEDTIPDPVVDQKDYYFPVIQYFEGKGTVVFPVNLKEKDVQFMQ
jgi:branched-chain amino acid transport system substrate-binding protein